MDIIYKNTDELIPYENNPRNNDNAVESVAISIKQFGFKVPIVIDANNIIVAGHTRLKAAKKLGIETVPCIVADDLTDEQVKAYRLADNKVGEISAWDYFKLDIELQDINIDMSMFGFVDEELAKDVNIDEFFKESEPAPKEPKLTQCPFCGESFELP